MKYLLIEPTNDQIKSVREAAYVYLDKKRDVHYSCEEIDVNDLPVGAIDLGLPSGLKWSSHNVGATLPCDYGLLFQFGRTDGYAYGSAIITDGAATDASSWGHGLVKCPNYEVPITSSGKTYAAGETLDLEDDAAYVNMGANWRMPTSDNITELINNTTSKWCQCTTLGEGHENHSISGRLFTSKTDDSKKIFIPAAGYFGAYYGAFYDSGSDGYVWSSSVHADYSNYAYNLYFNSGYCYLIDNNRYYGFSVRGVCL